MNRPDRLNAFDYALYASMTASLRAAEVDEGVHVVVLTGTGRAFSSGADRAPVTPIRAEAFDEFLAALSIAKPLIVAVNGVAVGIGLTLLPHCDLVLVDADARLRTPFTVLGVAPEAGSSYLLQALLGPQRAARVLYTSDWISATEAVELGLAESVSAAGHVLDDALALAQRIAAFPLPSLQATRSTLVAARAGALRAALAAERAAWKGLALPAYRQ